jgi:hypothetical protein
MTTITQSSGSRHPETLKPGALLRSESGQVYKCTSICLHGLTFMPMVMYQRVGHDKQELTCAASEMLDTPIAGQPRFSAIAPADPLPLKKFWFEHGGEPETLSLILTKYSEPWRFALTARYLYRLFEAAQSAQVDLDLETGLALLFRHIAMTPGATPEAQAEQAWLAVKSLSASFKKAPVDWDRLCELGAPGAFGVVSDLLRSPLAFEPLEFCVHEELLWEEARPLHSGVDARKAYDTQRLQALLELAGKGPLFSKAQEGWERKARTNLEGLRQAWLKKYSQ